MTTTNNAQQEDELWNAAMIWQTSNRFFKTTFVLCCGSVVLFLLALTGTSIQSTTTPTITQQQVRRISSNDNISLYQTVHHHHGETTTTVSSESPPSFRKLKQGSFKSEGDRDRPIEVGEWKPPDNKNFRKIYTFYIERDHNIKEKDDAMQQRWSNAWREAGYNPLVLTTDDAKKHSDYDAIQTELQSFFGRATLFDKDHVDCYNRYLAMAAAGGDNGGIMVDIDTFPGSDASLWTSATPPLAFTVYCPTATTTAAVDDSSSWLQGRQSGQACAAASSSPDEWTRVAKLALWMTKHKATERTWTDFHSLLALTSSPEQAVRLVTNVELNQNSEARGWDVCSFRTVM